MLTHFQISPLQCMFVMTYSGSVFADLRPVHSFWPGCWERWARALRLGQVCSWGVWDSRCRGICPSTVSRKVSECPVSCWTFEQECPCQEYENHIQKCLSIFYSFKEHKMTDLTVKWILLPTIFSQFLHQLPDSLLTSHFFLVSHIFMETKILEQSYCYFCDNSKPYR